VYQIRTIRSDVKPLAQILVQATRQVQSAVAVLRKLKGPKGILKHCIEINRLENDGDFASRTAVGTLFAEVSDPLEVIKWKEIYENLEEAVDRCEDVANVLEGIALKNA
jgi:hypothetical protein